MTDVTRAAVLTEFGKPLEIRPPYLHGTFADHAHIHPRAGRIRVPDAVSSELASAASCALRSVIAEFDRLGALDYRDTVLIQGAGPLGLFATAVASMHAPRRLIVIGAPDARLELAEEFGADATISIEAYPDLAERTAIVHELTQGRGADVLFEFAGSAHAFGEGVEMAAPKARYVMAGAVGGTPRPVSAPSSSSAISRSSARSGRQLAPMWTRWVHRTLQRPIRVGPATRPRSVLTRRRHAAAAAHE